MKILILGASGFLGRAISAEFAEGGSEVFTASRGQAANSDGRRHFQIDVAERETLKRIENLRAVDTVIHAAGLAHRFGRTDADAFERVNALGTENAAQTAAQMGVRHFIYISTVAVYGNANRNAANRSPVNEAAICQPRGAYAASKYAGEAAARRICGENGIDLTVLRPATIVGEGDPGNLTRLIRLVDKNRFVWVGAGDNLKTLIYKKDVARAVRLAANTSTGGAPLRIYNVAAQPIRMREIVSEISNVLGKKIPNVSLPGKLAVETLEAAWRLSGSNKLERLADTARKWISDENFCALKIRSELGFEPLTTAREAVGRQAEFYKSIRRE